ncbi:TetR/AcrR family transcriptional regulator [Paenibacillus sp. Z6-24]
MDKQNVIETAEQLFAGRSYDSVSIEELARGCGMSPSRLYTLFGSKEEVWSAVVRKIGEDIQQGLFRLYSDHRLDARLKLAWLIEMYVSAMSRKNSYTTANEGFMQQTGQVEDHAPIQQELEYQLSTLLIEMMNVVIYEMKDDHGEPLWNWDRLQTKIRISHHNVLLEAVQSQENLYRSKLMLHQMNVSDSFRRKCWQSFRQMEKKALGEQHRLYLVRAWLDFIEQEPTLIGECMQLLDCHQRHIQ